MSCVNEKKRHEKNDTTGEMDFRELCYSRAGRMLNWSSNRNRFRSFWDFYRTRQINRHRRAHALLGFSRNLPAGLPDHGVNGCKTEPGSLLFCREKWFEDP